MASVKDTEGRITGINRIEPSSKGGINSRPMRGANQNQPMLKAVTNIKAKNDFIFLGRINASVAITIIKNMLIDTIFLGNIKAKLVISTIAGISKNVTRWFRHQRKIF